jgi:putative membrane protein insertion efficiency factor
VKRIRGLLPVMVLAPLRAYRRFISPGLPRRCRYEPTCSAYAEQAILELGVVRGAIVASWRVLRCNPLSRGGFDPLEARRLLNPARRGANADPPATLRRTREGTAP